MNKIQNLITLFRQFQTQNTNYLQNKKEETFEDDETKNEDDLIKKAESMLDRRLEEKQRLETLIETGTEIKIIINLMKKEMEDMMEMIEEDDKKTEEEIKKLIDKIKEIRQRKTDKEKLKNPKRKKRCSS